MSTVSTRSRRWWIALLVIVVLGAVYALGGFYGVPRLARSVAVAEVEKLGRRLEIGEIRFNPFTFETQIAALRMTEADGAPLLGFESLYVNLDAAASIIERGAVLQELTWAAPDVALVVEKDGSINLAKLAPPSTEPAPPKDEQATLPHLRIAVLRIERGRVGVEDRSRPEPFALALTPIEFTLNDFRTDLGHENVYAFSGTATTGEQLEWTGDFTVQPLGSRGSFALRNLQAATLAGYLQDLLPMRLVSGVAETAGEYRLSLDPALSLDLHLPAVSLRDWAIAERGRESKTSPLAVSEIAVREVQVSLAKREVAVQGLAVKGLRADLRREADGSLNLSRLFASSAQVAVAKPAPVEVSAAPAPPPWRVSLAQLVLEDAVVAAEDRTVTPAVQLALKPINVSVAGISTDLAAPVQISASLGINQGGRLRVDGALHPQPLKTQLKLEAKEIDLSIVQPYLAGLTGVVMKSARLGVKGALDLAQPADAPMRVGFSGEASVAQLQVQEGSTKQDLLSWRDLKLGGIEYRQTPDRLDIAQISLLQPYAKVVIGPDRELNISRALVAPGGQKAAEPKVAVRSTKQEKSAPPMAVQVKTIRVERGLLSFTDLSIDPQFSAGIMELRGSIVGLSTDPAKSAKIDLQGRVDEFAPVLIQGTMNPLAFDRHTDVALSFRNMDLIRFNPYSGRFAGYNITKGKLTTELKYRIVDRALEAEHHVIVDQLEFGEATGSKDAVPLPVKLAVALLKDRHGVIDLGLPVRGNLDDPTFKVGPLVWKVLVNLLTKAVTAPFSALASLFGGGEELAYVEFAPGSAALSEAESTKLGSLQKALIERPALKLDVPYALSDAEDGAVLARTELERRLQPKTPVPAELTPEQQQKLRLRALEALHQELLGKKPTYPPEAAADKNAERAAQIAWLEQALRPKLAPGEAGLEALAAERARAVQKLLLASPDIAPERLFLTSRRAARLSEAGQVRMELGLQ